MKDTSVLIAIIVGIFGLFSGGSLVAILRMRHDKKLGIKTHELEEDKVLDLRWQAMLDQQKKNLIDPLSDRVQAQDAEIAELRRDIKEVKHKYWRAIKLARELYSYIALHIPDNADPIPEIPPELNEDI